MPKEETQTFNSGTAQFYSVENIAPPGALPKDGIRYKGTLRYDERTVGIKRYYTAMQSNTRVDALIRCPRREEITPQDVTVLRGLQSRVVQIQYPKEAVPPVMDISLERLGKLYDVRDS